VIDRGTGDGVRKENFRPHRSATVGRVDLDFCNYLVEGCEIVGLFLEEPPKPVLEHGVRGFAVAGKPRVTHCTIKGMPAACAQVSGDGARRPSQ
jgi:hypothetical protein